MSLSPKHYNFVGGPLDGQPLDLIYWQTNAFLRTDGKDFYSRRCLLYADKQVNGYFAVYYLGRLEDDLKYQEFQIPFPRRDLDDQDNLDELCSKIVEYTTRKPSEIYIPVIQVKRDSLWIVQQAFHKTTEIDLVNEFIEFIKTVEFDEDHCS